MTSSFPTKPRTDDQTRAELLRLLGVPDHDNIFVLGCFARHVTVFSQQVRALNLIDALAKEGRLSPYSSVAIIGGGIAGMTAAAGAFVKGVAAVSVFEKRDATMRDQRTCLERHLHPHIYDWPAHGELGKIAGLPVMNWTAGEAKDVVLQLEDEWKRIASAITMVDEENCPRTEPRVITDCQSLEIRRAPGRRAEVAVNAGSWQLFDVVIITVGFGTDATEFTSGYWENVGLDHHQRENESESWLVSGFGDGALTDLMRLCIRDFLHEKVIEAADSITRESVGQELLIAERTLAEDPVGRAKAYSRAAEKIQLPFDKNKYLAKRRIGPVYLNCTEEQLFSPRASILNRLIVAALLKEKRFELLPGEIAHVTKRDNLHDVQLKSGHTQSFHHVILRHGPHAALVPGQVPKKTLEAAFPSIWNATKQIRDIWSTVPQFEDWTRTPLYGQNDFQPGKSYRHQLRVSFAGKLGCVVIANSRPHDQPGLGYDVSSALRDFYERLKSIQTNAQVELTPEVIQVTDLFDTAAPWKFERAVRALCESDLAVFDLTDEESAVMLLLGIRAAARRGITIPITRNLLKDKQLSFNISSLNPIYFSPGLEGKNSWHLLASAFEAGFRAINSQPDSYLDMPVFDAVRQIGANTAVRQPERQILVLRWFDDRYGVPLHKTIDPLLKIWYKRDKPTEILTTLDSQSPQLVEQRLYGEIRLTKLCLVDWTGWRPNVFFEMGVRLAVNAEEPVHLYCTKEPLPWKGKPWPGEADQPTSGDLKKFFEPTEFHFTDIGRLTKRLDPTLVTRKPKGQLSAGRVYAVVADTVDWSREPGGDRVEALLSFRSHILDGPAPPEDSTPAPVLYAERFTEHARVSSIEHLLAAWYYLIGRYDLIQGSLAPDDPNVQSLVKIGREVTARMRKANDPAYLNLRRSIRKELRRLEGRSDGDTGVITTARNLKNRAMDARDDGEWGEAHDLLDQADGMLISALENLDQHPDPLQAEDVFRRDLLAQVGHIRGSKGGVYSRQREYENSAKAFDAGNTYERELDSTDKPNSYNLVQRLVARTLLAPAAIEIKGAMVLDENLDKELHAAYREVRRQIEKARPNDAYAQADAFMVLLLLNEPGWRAELTKFIDLANKDRYALEVTLDVVDRLVSRATEERVDGFQPRLADASQILRSRLDATS
jgi:hypothetical protein